MNAKIVRADIALDGESSALVVELESSGRLVKITIAGGREFAQTVADAIRTAGADSLSDMRGRLVTAIASRGEVVGYRSIARPHLFVVGDA